VRAPANRGVKDFLREGWHSVNGARQHGGEIVTPHLHAVWRLGARSAKRKQRVVDRLQRGMGRRVFHLPIVVQMEQPFMLSASAALWSAIRLFDCTALSLPSLRA
jgi:hypothetical protein